MARVCPKCGLPPDICECVDTERSFRILKRKEFHTDCPVPLEVLEKMIHVRWLNAFEIEIWWAE